ncbi:LysR family transcriptional regulator [Gallaecimonas kandeliae]|uniref:LysR family transcriptional regulator n=1 Tax=Gallaecimonas kandeliae TaxID=3029055 RepID=UPI002649A6EB|nr:LysR family transcriptional regulator [Gallaecimonas kandeliae]WKE66498.1 LysR family transcriptional regulator [Gallaecimonas kandeliae]
MNQLEQIRIFVELVKAGSATQAARQLNLATSAVSRRLKELEARLGTELLHRTTRSMTLTDDGRAYYERCVRILEDLDEAERELGSRSGELSGRLRITTPWSFGVSHLVPAITEFMYLHPRVEIDLDMNDRKVDLVAEGFDLAIRIGELEDSSLVARKLAPVSHVVAAAPDYFQRHGRPQSPQELAGHQGLCYANLKAPGQWLYFDDQGRRQSVKVPIRFRASNGDALRHAAIAGLGVLCEPSFITYQAIRQGLLEPVLTQYRWYQMGIYALYPGTRHLSPRVRGFIDFLGKRFGDHPEWEAALDPFRA